MVYVLQFIQEVLQYSLVTKHTLQLLCLDTRKKFFYSENLHSLEQPARGRGRVPLAGDFQHVTGQGARSSHLSFLSHETLDQMTFQGPFQPGLFYDPVT